jgi:phosphoribosylformylglycinamidine synthase
VLLPSTDAGPAATLTWNDSGRFIDRWVRLRVDGEKCVFLRGIESLELPIAHAEGKFVARDSQVLDALDSGGQLVLRYTGRNGEADPSSPDNPNGSQRHVAGLCDASGRVLGLMPHPERNLDPTHHPNWTRRAARQAGDGLRVFQNAVEYFAA